MITTAIAAKDKQFPFRLQPYDCSTAPCRNDFIYNDRNWRAMISTANLLRRGMHSSSKQDKVISLLNLDAGNQLAQFADKKFGSMCYIPSLISIANQTYHWQHVKYWANEIKAQNRIKRLLVEIITGDETKTVASWYITWYWWRFDEFFLWRFEMSWSF